MTGSNAGFVLQERDRHLLAELATTMKVVDREQTKIVAGFGSHSRTNRRLHSLVKAGLLRRFALGTKRGGQKFLYSLSTEGALLLGVPFRGLRRRKDAMLLVDFGVQHQLVVNEIYCALKYRSLPPGIVFRSWSPVEKPLLPSVRIIPDGYLTFEAHGRIMSAFLEVDLGHERRAVWLEKVRNYVGVAASGQWTGERGETRFLVLVLTTTHRKLESIRSLIARETTKIFRLTTFDAFRSQGFFAPIWVRPTGKDREGLFESPPFNLLSTYCDNRGRHHL